MPDQPDHGEQSYRGSGRLTGGRAVITGGQVDRVLKTNLYAMFWLCKAALPHLRPGSVIVNTASVQAFQPSAHLLDYATTKAGIVAFTKALAQHLAERGIRVNAVAPGPIWTPLIPATMPPEQVAKFGADTPLGRAGQPVELASSYVFRIPGVQLRHRRDARHHRGQTGHLTFRRALARREPVSTLSMRKPAPRRGGGTVSRSLSADTAPLVVLLVEDDPGDVALVQDAFADQDVATRLHHVADGADALAFLRRQDRFHDAPRPDLVLLDLNMPRVDGRQVLVEMKTDDLLKTIPVIVFTTSATDTDIVYSYDAHANAYVTKPIDLDDFDRILTVIRRFYGAVATLPTPRA